MNIHAIQQQGYNLLHNGSIALAHIEGNGIRIDMAKLAKTKEDIKRQMRQLQVDIEKEQYWKQWRARYGEKANLSSRQQLGTILHVDLQHEVITETGSGLPQMNEENLQKLNSRVKGLDKLVKYLKYDKALGTFLRGIEREIVDSRLHPSFNLHTVRTYRSSSQDPNFQNFPVRDKEISEIIRSHFIASEGHVLVENDFKGAEVVVSAAYHKDSNFINYILHPEKNDMHRDMAAQIYKLKTKDVTKDIRYGAKNKFVFPQFYGDWYIACAKHLWEWIEIGKLKGPDGDSLYKHLERKGITELGKLDPELDPEPDTFEAHLKEVEYDFWNNRFMQYGKWRKTWYKQYLDRGYFDMLTGFRVSGMFDRNAVVNYPVQGSAFHCLLWCLIKINKVLRKFKMKSKLVGQIHDSMLADVAIDELKDYLCIVEEVVTVGLREEFGWLVVPLEIETEICPVGGNWFQKKPTKFKQGKFFHPEHKDRFTTDAQKFLKTL